MKYVLVTGAAGGLGSAVVNSLAEKDFFIFATDVKDVKFEARNVKFFQSDITSNESIEELKRKIKKHTDTLFGIVNTAGIFFLDSFVEGEEEKLRKIIEINFFGTYKVNKIFFEMLKPKYSKIINVASEVSRYTPQPFNGFYTLSKQMVDTYTHALRRELNYLDIKVIKIEPGSFKTKMLNAADDEFHILVDKTAYYKNNLLKLKKLMDDELSKENNPKKFGKLVLKILKRKKNKLNYRICNSYKLALLGMLPARMQDRLLKRIIR